MKPVFGFNKKVEQKKPVRDITFYSVEEEVLFNLTKHVFIGVSTYEFWSGHPEWRYCLQSGGVRGYTYEIGKLDEHPLRLSCLFVQIGKEMCMFAESTSRVSDRSVSEAWIVRNVLKPNGLNWRENVGDYMDIPSSLVRHVRELGYWEDPDVKSIQEQGRKMVRIKPKAEYYDGDLVANAIEEFTGK